jgi:hypothetical protein
MGLYLLSSTTVPAGGVSTISFSNIDQTGSDLWVIGLTRSTTTDENVVLYLNGNTTSGNYVAGWLDGRGTTESSGATVFNNIVRQTQSVARANDFAAWQITMHDYAGNQQKRVWSSWGGHRSTTAALQFSGTSSTQLTANTNAITSFELRPTVGFAEGSQIYLYMVRS